MDTALDRWIENLATYHYEMHKINERIVSYGVCNNGDRPHGDAHPAAFIGCCRKAASNCLQHNRVILNEAFSTSNFSIVMESRMPNSALLL